MSPLFKDVAERMARTFAQAFLATYGLSLAQVMDMSLLQQAATSGGAAVLALIMGLASGRLGSSDSASALK